jgi:hypothetical protein
MPPAQALIDTNDDPDPASEVGQRMAAATQTAQGVMTTWAIYGQRGDTRDQAQRRGDRVDDRSTDLGDEDTRRAVVENRTELAGEVREEVAHEPQRATVRLLSVLDAGLDACGDGSVLTEEQRAEVRRSFHVVPNPDEVAEKMAQLAADEATEAGAMWATHDDDPATVSYIGGTNPRAAGTARVRDAIGDASEQVAEEALDHDDPLGDEHRLDDGMTDRDPLALNAWEAPEGQLGADPDRDHRR